MLKLQKPKSVSGKRRSPNIKVINSQLTAEPQAQPLKICALISVNISGALPNVRKVSRFQKLTDHVLICVRVLLCKVGNIAIAPNRASTVKEVISHTLCIYVNFAVFLE